MELQVVGHRAGWPDVKSPTSAYLVFAESATILLDCGAGVTSVLRDLIDVQDLDGIWISHMHPDHCFDLQILAMVRSYQRNSVQPRDRNETGRCPLYLPIGATEKVKAVNDLYQADTPEYQYFNSMFTDEFECIEYSPRDTLKLGDCTMQTMPMVHAGGSSAIRISDAEGKSIVYSGDTGWCDQLVDLATGADLLVCETTVDEPDKSGQGHLCAREAGRVAAESGTEHLLLTHFFDVTDDALRQRVQDASSLYDGRVTLAEVRKSIAV